MSLIKFRKFKIKYRVGGGLKEIEKNVYSQISNSLGPN